MCIFLETFDSNGPFPGNNLSGLLNNLDSLFDFYILKKGNAFLDLSDRFRCIVYLMALAFRLASEFCHYIMCLLV